MKNEKRVQRVIMNPSKPLISYGHKKSEVFAVVLKTILL